MSNLISVPANLRDIAGHFDQVVAQYKNNEPVRHAVQHARDGIIRHFPASERS